MGSPCGEDWLTWQDVRDLADAEAQADGTAVQYVTPWRQRSVHLVHGRPQSVIRPVRVRPGARIYARDVWRAPWRDSLRQVPVPCVLLTSFNDAHVQAHALTLLESRIRRWFAVQVATSHPKLTAMPIGIDRRDAASLRRPLTNPRDIVLYVNFQPRTDERRTLLTSFCARPFATVAPWSLQAQASAVGYGPPMGSAAYAAQLARSRFVLSPPGRGWDCYRTYEAIVMGAIPIVKRHPPMSDVVAGLPVLLVDDWAEVTPERLNREWAQRNPAPDLTRLTWAYWRDRIQQEAHAAA